MDYFPTADGINRKDMMDIRNLYKQFKFIEADLKYQ